MDDAAHAVDKLVPIVDEAAPGVDEPAPGVDEPAPGVDEPAPGVDEPAPLTEPSQQDEQPPAPIPGIQRAESNGTSNFGLLFETLIEFPKQVIQLFLQESLNPGLDFI